jgi:hypothetical protein
MINRRELNLSDPDSEALKTMAVNTRAELRQMLAEGLAKSRRALEETTEDHLTKMWRFRMNDRVVSEGPRYAMISNGAMTHLAHHLAAFVGGEGAGDLWSVPRQRVLRRWKCRVGSDNAGESRKARYNL